MTDAELQPCTRFEWERIVRRIRMPQGTKLLACILAQYGDAQGRHIRPGTDRLAAVTDMGERTVRRHLQALRDLGLVARVRGGGGRGGQGQVAAEWRLTVPTDLLERVDMLGPDEGTAANTVAGDPCGKPLADPVDNRGTPVTQMAAVREAREAEHRPLGTEHRPSDARTPATQVAAHQETNQGTTKTPPQVSTSPVDERASRSRADPPAVPPPPGWRKRHRADPTTDPTREAS